MFLFGTLLAAAIAAVSFLGWWLLRAHRMPLGNFVGVMALAVWLAGVGIAWVVDRGPAGQSQPVRPVDLVAWPASKPSPLVSADVRAPAPRAENGAIASVESLLGRLAANPNDADGWALLAQSYAYTADDAALERAVKRAVELGVDEQGLRERVAGARRSMHPETFSAGEARP
jgi:hypothetical protein